MPVPGHSPDHFFSNWLQFGTGGLCFPAAAALNALLGTIGFQSKLVLAWMPDNMHASLVVTIDDKDYFVDQSVPHSTPLLIDPDSLEASPGWRMRLFHQNGRFHYRWMTFRMQSQEEIGCVFDRDQYRRSNNEQMLRENSRRYLQCKTWSKYNYNLNTTIYRDALLVRIVEGERQVIISHDGKVTQADLNAIQREELLINTFGICEEIVRKLPPDLPTIRQTISVR
jgi:N-hydroxyarylamine O-acetyltransferase